MPAIHVRRRASAVTLGAVIAVGALAACSTSRTPVATPLSVLAQSVAPASPSATTSGPAGAVNGNPIPTSTTNGVDRLTPNAALARARAAFLAARSTQFKGQVTEGGKKIVLDSRIAAGGGRMTIKQNGVTVNVLLVGKTVYMSGDLAFWRQITGSTAGARTMVNKFMRASTSNPVAKEALMFLDKRQVAANLLPKSGATSGKVTMFAGRPVFEVSDGEGVFDIALIGEPCPVRLSAPGGELLFSCGITVDLTPPPASRVIDVPKK